jgi:hypothetical protein
MKFFSRSDSEKPRERFYLLAGMGGSAAKRKHKRILAWAIAAGLVVSLILAAAMFLLNRSGK